MGKRTEKRSIWRFKSLLTTAIEPLENRRLFTVSTDVAGWTVVTPASDTHVIYVSNSSGNDANSGLTQSAPIKTLSKAQSLVRDGYADWVLLKRGDTFESFGEWRKHGRSAQEPLYISAYGSGARPQINSGTSYGFITYGSGGATGRSIDNLIISSLSFFPNTYDGTNGTGDTAGIRLLCQGQNVLIEDCRVAGYKDDITVEGGDNGSRNVTIRRCEILDSHAALTVGNGHSQGIYVNSLAKDVTIEENIIDHNGWRANTPSDRTFYNHDIYAYNGAQNVIVRNNVIAEASFYGAKMRAGGTITGNFFAHNSESVYLESDALVANNVVTEAVDMPANNWGVGINTQQAPSATIRGNLITKVLSATASGVAGIQLFNNGTPFSGLIENNIVYSWRNGLLNNTPGNGPGSVVIRNNQFQIGYTSAAVSHNSTAPASTFVYQGNVYSTGSSTNVNRIAGTFQSLSQWISKTGESNAQYQTLSYPDPTRDIERYNALQGGAASFDTFIATARAMDKSNWNLAYTAPAVNAWMFGGFGVSQAPVISAAAFNWQSMPLSLDITFSTDVGSSLTSSDLVMKNVETGLTVPTQLTSYDARTFTGHFSISGTLADGDYQATLGSGSVSAFGQSLATNYTFNFFTQLGDNNHDRRVDSADFSILAANFGQKGKTYAHGDFNYDGVVNSLDFNALASKFGTYLAPAAGTSAGQTLALPSAQASTSLFASTPIADPTADIVLRDPIDSVL